MKNDYIQVRISEEEKAELSEMSAELDKPISQIVREGFREKLDQWRATKAQAVPAEVGL